MSSTVLASRAKRNRSSDEKYYGRKAVSESVEDGGRGMIKSSPGTPGSPSPKMSNATTV